MLLAAPTTFAASRAAKERAARTACLAGDYGKGATILSELFVDTKDPTYIYNQGRCFEQNAHYQEAIARFQEYLRVGEDVSEKDKVEAKKHITECEDMVAKQSGHLEMTAPLAPAPPSATAQAPLVTPGIAQEPARPTQSVAAMPTNFTQTSVAPASLPVGSRGSGMRIAGIATAAAGGAALVTGVILNIKVNSMASDFQTPNGYTPSKESSRASYETLGWLSYGLGAACITTGAILYVLGLRSGVNSSSSVALLPAFAPSGGAAILKGAF